MNKELINNLNPQNYSVWDKKVEVEESNYNWNGDPFPFKPLDETRSKNFTVAELFSGCGGTSKGFEMAGFEVIFGSDIHKPSIETFRKNHRRAATILGDVQKITPEDIRMLIGNRKIDVLIAGLPCQGFSLNNRKRWEKDKRNYLFIEFVRFIKGLQPKIVLLENVSGLRSTANGAFINAIIEAIESVGDYSVTYKILDALNYEVPQVRKRILFIGFPSGEKFTWPRKTHNRNSDIHYLTVMDAIYDLPPLNSGEKAIYYSGEPQMDYQKLMRNDVKVLTNHRAPKHLLSTIEKIMTTKPGEPMYKCFTQRIRLSWNLPSPTQVAGGIRPQFQFGHPEQPRGLTVRERARIQSFPDDFVFYGGIVQGRVQTGNAVPPLLAKAIATSIKHVLQNI